MISCQTFRTHLRPGSDDAEVLGHLRKCDACLDYAARIDPENFFRAIGGEELEPPGGVDAFAAEVMAQVRTRQVEGSVARRLLVAPRRLAAAAAIVVAIGVGAVVYDHAQRTESHSVTIARAPVTHPKQLATKPVVETYQSQSATIVEVPSEGTDDVKMVMIFDDSLPADL